MAFSYNPSLPTDRDKVRFLIQDTNSDNVQFQDEEINAILLDYPNPYETAYVLAMSLSAKYSALADMALGDYQIKYSTLSSSYLDLAKAMKATDTQVVVSRSAIPYAGGISASDKASNDDGDTIQGIFRRGMMDYPGNKYY